MKLKVLATLCILFSFLFFSCKKNNIDTTPVTPPENNGFNIPAHSPVNGRISGIVVDENNSGISNATVNYAGIDYQTDANGFFDIENVVLDKYITTVTAAKTGYFKAYRSFSATESRNYVSIKLLPRQLAGTVDASAGGTISLTNGTTIQFAAGSIVIKSTGIAYSGTVNIFSTYIDPTRTDFAAIVPGSMMGHDSAHMFVLQSAGMIAVDMESPAGEALQLRTGSTANIHLPIPGSLVSKAPATINTWSLDDQGVWVKEGTASKNGDAYDMQVSHFSFWNADVPANAVYLTIHIQDQDGHPLPDTWINLTVPNNNTWWATTNGLTDSAGIAAGLVPANLGLAMSVIPNIYNCNTPIATQNIGPFANDTSINITVTINSSQHINVTGTVDSCNNQPLQHAVATIYMGNNSYTTPVTNGTYNTWIPYCSSVTTLSVHIHDNTGVYVNSGQVSITGGTVNVPVQTICSSSNASFTFVSCEVKGVYSAVIPVNPDNYIMCIVDVQTLGPWEISGGSQSEIYFHGSGTFTQVGTDTVYLTSTGHTDNPGATTSLLTAGNGQTCSSVYTVAPVTERADFWLESYNYHINGDFHVNVPLNDGPVSYGNTITQIVDVSTPGTYALQSEEINGIIFYATGRFNNIGVDSIVFKASGTPLAAEGSHFGYWTGSITSSADATIVVDVPLAQFTFTGAPGNCTSPNSTGNFHDGILLNTSNYVQLNVDVQTPGPYYIETNTANGFKLMESGVFNTTGSYSIPLFGEGTPISPITSSFVPIGNGTIQGCTFTVSVN